MTIAPTTSTASPTQTATATPTAVPLGRHRRRRLATFLRSSSFSPFSSPLSLSRSLQAPLSALCTADGHNATTIELANFGDSAMVQALLQAIMNGTTPLALLDGTTAQDTICQVETSLSLVAPVDVLDGNDDAAGETDGQAPVSNHKTILIAVLVPAAVLLVLFMAYRSRRS